MSRHPQHTPPCVRELDASEAFDLLNNACFIDVREAHELLSGKIPGALHLPLGHLLTQEDALEALPKAKRLIVYCQHGVRSLTGAEYLLARGFSDVAHLKGGIVQWRGEL